MVRFMQIRFALEKEKVNEKRPTKEELSAETKGKREERRKKKSGRKWKLVVVKFIRLRLALKKEKVNEKRPAKEELRTETKGKREEKRNKSDTRNGSGLWSGSCSSDLQ